MHWLDVFILVLLTVYVWQGWQKGVLLLVAELVAWFLGWSVGGLLAGPVTEALVRFGKLPELLAFLLAFFVVVLLVEQGTYKALEEVVKRAERQFLPGWWQHVIGSLLTLVVGSLFFGFVLLLILQLPLETWSLAEIRQSLSARLVMQYAQILEGVWATFGWGGWL